MPNYPTATHAAIVTCNLKVGDDPHQAHINNPHFLGRPILGRGGLPKRSGGYTCVGGFGKVLAKFITSNKGKDRRIPL